MITNFPKNIKQEAVSSEKETSMGVSSAGDKVVDVDSKAPQPRIQLSAVKLFSDRYPNYFADMNDQRSRLESIMVLSVLVIIALAVIAAWIYWDESYFHTDSDLVYYMGLAGGISMLITCFYAIRKRVKVFKKMFKVTTWYYIHLVTGVAGPVLIILHSNFSLKALNSTVALVSMLCVIASGIFGRYIYTRIGYHLHRQLIAIRNTEERLEKSMQQYKGKEVDVIGKTLSVLTASAITNPRSIFQVPTRFIALRARAAKCYIESSRAITVLIKRRAIQERWNKSSYRKELVKEKRFLREHINALVRIGRSHFYERLLVGWRIFHVPLIFILVISGSVHVLAIHMY